MNDYILTAISVVVGFTAMVVSSRKSGYIIGYKVSFRDQYSLDKSELESYCKIMSLIITSCFLIGAFFSQDAPTVFAFTIMNAAFIGYALAWEKLVKLKG